MHYLRLRSCGSKEFIKRTASAKIIEEGLRNSRLLWDPDQKEVHIEHPKAASKPKARVPNKSETDIMFVTSIPKMVIQL